MEPRKPLLGLASSNISTISKDIIKYYTYIRALHLTSLTHYNYYSAPRSMAEPHRTLWLTGFVA